MSPISLLTSGAAQAWCVPTNACELELYASYLSLDERARMSEFRFEPDRRAYLAAHGLARAALTACHPAVRPAAWAFTRTAAGRPEIFQPTPMRPVRFSISRTRDLVACLVAPEVDCGIDLESVERCTNLDVFRLDVLAPLEQVHLSNVPLAERTLEFVRYWTLKEAYAKACGLGLSLPFSQIAFARCGAGFHLLTAAVDTDAKGAWRFEQRDVGAGHVLTTALRGSRNPTEPVTFHFAVPNVSCPS